MRLHPRLGAVTAGAAALATAASVLVTASVAAADDDGPVEAGIYVEKIDGLPADFINGVDVSSILSEEESGVVFYDFAGNVADPFDVLAEAGINYVRVRVWNDPFNAAGDGYGAGNVNAERATEIGQRATAAGMKVLVDFHYSDFWADPSKQKAPKAWVGYSASEVADAAGAFTEATLEEMADAGVDVGMVQVGNETNGGVAGLTGWDNMSAVFSAGSAAVHDVYPDALVAVHFTDPQTSGWYATAAAQLDSHGVDYDVFASSYYPYWHGTTTNLTTVLNSIATTYGKQVMVAETSWVNTLADGDGTTNSVTAANDTSAYAVSVQGQAHEIREVMAAVNAVSGGAGLGVFYWEPAWIPVPGATLAERRALWAEFGSGWATVAASEYDPGAPTANAEGSGWDNQALFAYDGHPLESLRAFAYARTGAVTEREVSSVAEPSVTFTHGDTITLPATVTVTYNDNSTEQQAVTWDNMLPWITSPGVYTVLGTTEDGLATKVTVTVRARNYLTNGSFEDSASDITPWQLSTTTGAWLDTLWVKADSSNAKEGTNAINVFHNADFNFRGEQWVELAPGDYTLRGSAQGENQSPQLFVTTDAGTQTADFTLTGWVNWSTPAISFTVTSQQWVDVGFAGTGTAGAWAWYDDFELFDTLEAADTSGLEALVDQANSLTRSVFSADSLAVLDAALQPANIVLAASAPTAQQVADATVLVQDALDGLVVVGDIPNPSVGAVTATAVEGEPIILPATVPVLYYDGHRAQVPVTWDDVLDWVDGTGVYTIHGVTQDGYAAVVTLTVTATNWIVNGSFEDEDRSMWSLTGVDDGQAAIGWSGDSADGNYSVAFWWGSDYEFGVSQQVTGLPAGTYAASATAQGGDSPGTDSRVVTLTSDASTQSAGIDLAGWQAFRTATTPTVTVGEDGIATVAATFALTGNAWGTIDDFRLVRVPVAGDTTALLAAIDAANAIDRSLYEAPGLAALDHALAAAAIVLQADGASQVKIDEATAQITSAIVGLDLIDVPFTKAPVPTILGTAKVGYALTATAGTWVPAASVTYQWRRDGAAIPGAKAAKYVLTKADAGRTITVAVTGARADYITTTKVSAGVKVESIFTATPRPAISGKPIAGAKLTAVVGTWTPKPSKFTYQWYANGKAISKATGSTYKVKSGDVGKKITVKVTATRAGYTPVSQVSKAVTVVKKFSRTGYASISGTAKVGKVLKAHRGLWSPAPKGYSFQWYRNGKAIPGANGVTYKLSSADKGKKVTVKVTVRKSGYLSTSHTSPAKTVR